MKKTLLLILALLAVLSALLLPGCGTGVSRTGVSTSGGTSNDTEATKSIANKLAAAQPTPTDIDYSLERYNLIRRAYWVNGQREKANALVCPVQKPLGYVALFAGNTAVARFVVDGKVTSLNSYLSPDSEYYELVSGGNMSNWKTNKWLSDVDGSFGENDSGIFFFTPDGNYWEWTGEYLYSDVPFEIDNPVVRYEVSG